MANPNSDVNTSEENINNIDKKNIDSEVPEEIIDSEKPHNFIDEILKYNPIDPLSKIFREFLHKFQVRGKFDRLFYWGSYSFIREILRRIWNLRIEGEMFPEYGAGIVIGNFQSPLDPLFIGAAVQRRIRWMTDKLHFETPILKTIMKNLGAFSLKRGQNEQKVYEKSKRIIQKGDWLGTFPEIIQDKDEKLGEFRTGSIKLAVELGVPIVPTCVIGTHDFFPRGKLIIKPSEVIVRIGKPIFFEEYIGKQLTYPEAKKIASKLRDEISSLLEDENLTEIDKEIKEISSDSHQDIEITSKPSGISNYLKSFGINILNFMDDWWYSLLRNAEIFDFRDQFQKLLYSVSGIFIQYYCNLMNPYRAIDYEKYIPDKGGALIVANHNSEWDVIILPMSIWKNNNRIIYQMAKQSLFKLPVVNAFIRSHHAFPIKRGEGDTGSFLYAKEHLEKGHLVLIYPEGGRNEGGGNLLPGHTGAVRLAIEAKVPIIPIGLTGTENIFPRRGKMINIGKGCILKAGEPFMDHQKYWDQPNLPSFEELQQLTDKTMERIRGLLLYNDINS